VGPDDLVIEVGPGTGTLTEELLARAGEVVAVEIDRDLAKALRERFGSNEKFHLIEGDALDGKHDISPDLRAHLAAVSRTARPDGQRRRTKLVANLPYNIASPLVIDLLIEGVDLLAFTVQREVADRLRAAAGTDAYGPLTVTAQLLARVEVLRTLPPQAFWPPPKIESALVRMARDDRLGPRAREFSRFVQQIFSFRRKTLRRALAQAGFENAERVLISHAIDPRLRPEVLSPEQLLALFEQLNA
jgi:16S rRNA (adenine1518-N6/adenine1519-N6)-dimethyltransferase